MARARPRIVSAETPVIRSTSSGAQFVEAVAPVLGKAAVGEVLGDQHVKRAQRQGAVGPRADPDPLRADRPGGLAAPGVDHDDPGAPLHGPFEPAQVDRRRIGRRVGAPDQDQIRVVEVVGEVAEMVAEAGARRDHAVRGVAERADAGRIRRAEGKQHGIGRGFRRVAGRVELGQAELEIAPPGIDAGGLGAVPRRGLAQGADEHFVGLVPGDALETARAARPNAPLGIKQAVVGIDDLRRPCAARADDAERMIAQRSQALDPAVY